MSGHSKWAQIKRSKGVADKRRSTLFSKLTRAITIAARNGGDPNFNVTLRLAILKAKEANMPADNIERAIKKGTGEDSEGQIKEAMFEGFGPGGAALLIQAATDKSTRTLSDLRNIFSKNDARLGGANSVAWMFEQRGVIVIDPAGKNKDEIELTAIDAGAENVEESPAGVEVQTKPQEFDAVRKKLEEQGLKVVSAELSMIAKNPVSLDDNDTTKLANLVDAIDEQEDVVVVYTNVQ